MTSEDKSSWVCPICKRMVTLASIHGQENLTIALVAMNSIFTPLGSLDDSGKPYCAEFEVGAFVRHDRVCLPLKLSVVAGFEKATRLLAEFEKTAAVGRQLKQSMRAAKQSADEFEKEWQRIINQETRRRKDEG